MAWAARDQRQLLAIVEQLLVAGDAPEREGGGILRRISVGVELHHGGMTRQPGRMRVTRIQHRIFLPAQAPAMRCFRPAMPAPPVAPVVEMPARALPSARYPLHPTAHQPSISRLPFRAAPRTD